MVEDKRKPWTVSKLSNAVSKITFLNIKSGWEQFVLLTSDRHHDNLHADWNAEIKHLDRARERKAPIIDAGDWFCAMQGKYDPRSDMSQLRPEHKRPDYLNALIETAVPFYKDYADLIAVIARGNHETNIINRHGFDLTDVFVKELHRENTRAFTVAGGYGGYVRFQFKIRGTGRQSKMLKYYHGKGKGNAPVTRGVLDVNRMGVFMPDADIIHTGHSHDSWIMPVPRERVSQFGFVGRDYAWYVRTPGYKDEWEDGTSGWAIEQGSGPKPKGAIWLRFYLDGNKIRVEPSVDLL